jgi:hypothetical protein
MQTVAIDTRLRLFAFASAAGCNIISAPLELF